MSEQNSRKTHVRVDGLRFSMAIFPVVMVFALFPPRAEADKAQPGLEIHSTELVPSPEWATLQKLLMDTLDSAAITFYDTYVNEDGTLKYKEKYEGGMNSSDDMYEAFKGFSLFASYGGDLKIDDLHRYAWEGITRQFSRYGQIYREFDSNWDWMHHGEGYVDLYPLGLVKPDDPVFIDRSIRFAAMYTGEDPLAQNYDPDLKMMRASMNGSRGPKMEWTKRDWIPTNANLVYYHLPFDDIPGIDTTSAWINDHPENDLFKVLVKAMSDRMAKGDVPINLTAAPLVANAYLYTGDQKYVDWVTDYVGMWRQKTTENNGITPDNIGLSGKVGEYTGSWWGGYYGWKWVGGGMHIIRAELTGSKVATLLTGDTGWMDLPRSQMEVVRKNTISDDTYPKVAIRYDQNGWHHYISEPVNPYLQLWYMTQSKEDWNHLERLADAETRTRGSIRNRDLQWAYYLKGKNPGFAERALKEDFLKVAEKMNIIRNEHRDPETLVDNHFINGDPMILDALTMLMVGGMPVERQGEMLYSQVRYFDDQEKRPGLPRDVAALVSRIDGDMIVVELVNLSLVSSHNIIVQGGAYGEHQFTGVEWGAMGDEHDGNWQTSSIDDNQFHVNLDPGTGIMLRIGIKRFHNQPTYTFPWK